jgi:hypothetical protein
MAKRQDLNIDELLFHDGFSEEEEDDREEYLLDEPKEASEEEEDEDELLPELEIGENGHIVPRHRKRGRRDEEGDEEESPIVLDWDE